MYHTVQNSDERDNQYTKGVGKETWVSLLLGDLERLNITTIVLICQIPKAKS